MMYLMLFLLPIIFRALARYFGIEWDAISSDFDGFGSVGEGFVEIKNALHSQLLSKKTPSPQLRQQMVLRNSHAFSLGTTHTTFPNSNPPAFCW